MQLDQFAAATFASLSITRKTRENYQGAYRRHIAPSLGSHDLADITSSDVNAVLAGLPPSTAYQVFMVLKSLFREAIQAGLIAAAPTERLRVRMPAPAQQPFLRWEDVETAEFGAHTDHVRFLALHGLRWGEAVALEPSDIRGGRVHVWRSIHGLPKSRAGTRSVPYLGNFVEFDPDRRPLAAALKPYGVTIHSMRRTYAYLLKSNGVHISTAQRLLGHASVALTLSVYTAVLDEEIDEAGRLLHAATNSIHKPSASEQGHALRGRLISNE